MERKSSTEIAVDIQTTAKKAKGLFTKAICEKKVESSNRLKSRLKRRSKSEPFNKFVDNFEEADTPSR